MVPQQIHDIELKHIKVDGANVRQSEPDRELQELADSIKRHGQLQPVVLRGECAQPPYKLIIGQRRYLACKDILNKKSIQATFGGDMDDTQASIRSLAENMCRVDLGYEDTANAVTALYKHFDRSDRRVAKETGLSLQKVREFIYLEEKASPKTRRKLREGKVKPVDVKRALHAASDNIEKADELLDRMEKYGLDKHQKARMVEYAKKHPRASADEIIKGAQEPVIERSISVKLSDRARAGLQKAADKLDMAPDELAAKAVEEWLSSKGFVA
jgi:ParB family chromosome partitioning protein